MKKIYDAPEVDIELFVCDGDVLTYTTSSLEGEEVGEDF